MPTRTRRKATELGLPKMLEVVEFEIVRKSIPDEIFEFLKTISIDVQRMTNRMWALWRNYHFAQNSSVALDTFVAAYEIWVKTPKTERGEKPKCPVECFPKELDSLIYNDMKRFDHIHGKIISLTTQNVRSRIMSMPASHSAWKGWIQVLRDLHRQPHAEHGQPIPFDRGTLGNGPSIIVDGKKRAGKGIIPVFEPDDDSHGNYRFKMRFYPGPKKNVPGPIHQMELWSRGRKRQGQTATLKKIADGKLDFRGSKITFRKGKLYVAFCYYRELPKPKSLDMEKRAVLFPGRNDPLVLRLNGTRRKQFPQGRGRHIEVQRQRIWEHRWSAQSGYQYASSAAKGHGGNRGRRGWIHLETRWRDFVKVCNRNTARSVVNECVRQGIGKLVYLQPTGAKRDTRFIVTCGKNPDRRDGSGWDFYQLKTLLDRRCKEVGIEFTSRQVGGKSGGGRTLAA